MPEINYVIGDATDPPRNTPAVIVHVCNDIGGWGAGFVLAVSRRWPEPEKRYRAWHRGGEGIPFALGQVQIVPVEPNVFVANLIGQRGTGRGSDGRAPVRYEAIRDGLARVATFALANGASVHMPRIGCGLAGGKWEEAGRIVQEELADQDVPVSVYDLPSRT